MTVFVNDIRKMLKSDVFTGVYDKNGYTGKGKRFDGPDEEPGGRILTGSYHQRHYQFFQTSYYFPRGFIPKKDTPYLCIPKEKHVDKGKTTYINKYLFK